MISAPEGRQNTPEESAMPQSFACLHYHLIFSTKSRAPRIVPDLQPRLYEYLGGILHNHGGVLVAAGGMPDHVHLLVGLSREMAVAEAVRAVKANSSKWIHGTFAEQREFAWQNGYGAFTVSYSHLGQVRQYLAGQAEHHRRMTFQEEFLAFLKRHEIEYDERYIWD
jgi:REP element-mobilizing transposase RayT